MPLTVTDIDSLFPPMSMANPTNSNINRALRINGGFAPLAAEPGTASMPVPPPEEEAPPPETPPAPTTPPEEPVSP